MEWTLAGWWCFALKLLLRTTVRCDEPWTSQGEKAVYSRTVNRCEVAGLWVAKTPSRMKFNASEFGAKPSRFGVEAHKLGGDSMPSDC